MTTAVGDSIRSMIGKPKKKEPIERPAERKTDQEIGKDSPGQPITDRQTSPATDHAAPDGDHGDQSPGAARRKRAARVGSVLG